MERDISTKGAKDLVKNTSFDTQGRQRRMRGVRRQNIKINMQPANDALGLARKSAFLTAVLLILKIMYQSEFVILSIQIK